MRKITVIGLLAIISVACAKWFDKDVTLEKTTLLSPPDQFSDSLLSKTFWWDELDGVDEFQLQVVSPKFDSVVILALDTIVADLTFTANLNAGKYEWRVRPVNDSYKGIWTKRSFTIVATNNLSGQNITGALPADGYESNTYTQSFSWSAMTNADSYLFAIKNASGSTVYTEVVTSTSVDYTFTADGLYSWSVQGQNDISASFTKTNTIQIDSTAPILPVLSSPIINVDSIKSFPGVFKWGAVTDNGTSIIDTLLISSSSDFSSYAIAPVVGTDVTTLSVDSFASGTYYWTIGRRDAVGNYTGRASAKQFVVE